MTGMEFSYLNHNFYLNHTLEGSWGASKTAKVRTATPQGCLGYFPWVSCFLSNHQAVDTSFLSHTSRYENLRQRYWPNWSRCWLGSSSLGANPVKRLFVQVIHNESALRRRRTGEQDRVRGSGQGKRMKQGRYFRQCCQLQPDPAGSSGVQMALRVCLDTRQICSTFKLSHQLVLG